MKQQFVVVGPIQKHQTYKHLNTQKLTVFWCFQGVKREHLEEMSWIWDCFYKILNFEVLSLQFPVDLVTFTEEILNGKLHFICSVSLSYFPITNPPSTSKWQEKFIDKFWFLSASQQFDLLPHWGVLYCLSFIVLVI